MTESERVARLRRGYEAFNRGDFDAVAALLHPDVEWNPPPSSPEPVARRGREAARAFMEPNMFDEQQSEPLELIESGDRILVKARTTVRGTASGLVIDQVVYQLWTLADELVIRLEIFVDRDEALAALRA